VLAPYSALEVGISSLKSYLAGVEVGRVEGVPRELNTTAAADVLAALHKEGVVVA
jgi:hypothetical protein